MIDIIGVLSAMFQIIFSVIEYVYHKNHKETPLKGSIVPLVFALCVFFTKLLLIQKRNEEITVVLNCGEREGSSRRVTGKREGGVYQVDCHHHHHTAQVMIDIPPYEETFAEEL